MAILLTGTRDQALLAMVIQEAHQIAKQQRGFVGRTAVQKIMYFLKAIGIPMDYSFDIYHYGPFADEILRDMEWLQADGVITDQSQKPDVYSDYAPAQMIQELLDRHSDSLEPLRGKVRNLVQVLIPLRPERLELLATLDYIYRQERASRARGPWKDSVVERLLQLKGNKFPEKEVEKTYDQMTKAGLTES